ncbi:MAG TPA: hypothetical protein PLT27_11415 [Nitrospira sp.]|nr:hypothetical protein [Nitrospira sp.]
MVCGIVNGLDCEAGRRSIHENGDCLLGNLALSLDLGGFCLRAEQ